MPLWLWGALAMGATCGWLCGLLLQPEQARARARIIVLAAAATLAVVIAIVVRPAATLAFSATALLFSLSHAGWYFGLRSSKEQQT